MKTGKREKKTQQKRSKVKLWKKMTLKTEEQFIKRRNLENKHQKKKKKRTS